MKTFFSSQDFLFLTMLAQVYAEIFLKIETAVRASPVSPLSATAAHVGPILANLCLYKVRKRKRQDANAFL
jgi:hypothetical protein